MQSGYDIRTVHELLGHSSVNTTMINSHVLNVVGRCWTRRNYSAGSNMTCHRRQPIKLRKPFIGVHIQPFMSQSPRQR